MKGYPRVRECGDASPRAAETTGPAACKCTCRICGNARDNGTYSTREMMFGYRDRFTYFQCSRCGCLQIVSFPDDMDRYYPPQYYSFEIPRLAAVPSRPAQKLRAHAKHLRNVYAAFGRGTLGKILYAALPNPLVIDLLRRTLPPNGVNNLGITPQSRVLDVGCGSGTLLLELSDAGFENLVGVDPYIQTDIKYPNGVRVLKRTIHQISGRWDLIMFHHSFEHFSDPRETLEAVSRLLADGGLCVIRIPVVPCYAWEHYRENWVQLDAPRHYFLHSEASMRFLTAQTGLQIERITYDSTHFQFWGSEQYVRDIPLFSGRSYAVRPDDSAFSAGDISRFEEKAERLNAIRQGDQAAFYVRKGKSTADSIAPRG